MNQEDFKKVLLDEISYEMQNEKDWDGLFAGNISYNLTRLVSEIS